MDANCPICFNIPVTEKILPCNHSFCDTCMDNWKKGTCPTCRQRFRPDDEQSILDEYIDIRIAWLDNLLTNTVTRSFTLVKSTLECKMKRYAVNNENTETDEIMNFIFEKMKNKIALLFCRIVNGRETIKELKSITLVRTKTHNVYLEFIAAMNVILTEGENELDKHLNYQFNSSAEEKLKLKEQRARETNEKSGVAVYVLDLNV